jgi:hypothetical protein
MVILATAIKRLYLPLSGHLAAIPAARNPGAGV